MYADDLNAYKIVSGSTSKKMAVVSVGKVQEELHTWGVANQVIFDPNQESKHILSRTMPFGEDFKLLGVILDCMLDMEAAVRVVAGKVK